MEFGLPQYFPYHFLVWQLPSKLRECSFLYGTYIGAHLTSVILNAHLEYVKASNDT
uniref:Uncharacterized protein n=1 Tax=Picea sitchensis TaxID=3332 RepID=D5A8C6_PICSI|nr:unknown [Picea sitchensis]ADE76837.1 unknown [Picea sitchensis]